MGGEPPRPASTAKLSKHSEGTLSGYRSGIALAGHIPIGI